MLKCSKIAFTTSIALFIFVFVIFVSYITAIENEEIDSELYSTLVSNLKKTYNNEDYKEYSETFSDFMEDKKITYQEFKILSNKYNKCTTISIKRELLRRH
jgi:hypothetical protein